MFALRTHYRLSKRSEEDKAAILVMPTSVIHTYINIHTYIYIYVNLLLEYWFALAFNFQFARV